jgi:hypothetical protein
MNRASKVLSSILVTTAALVLLAGCGGGETAYSADDADASAAAEPAVLELSPEAVAILAQADLEDGTEDHVVSKCASCNLKMEGSEENVLQVGDYEMHFCSNTCSRRFEENTEALILELPHP